MKKIIYPGDGRELELTPQKEITFGRDERCDFVINRTLISRKHCKIYLQCGKAILEDNNSLNKTRINGREITVCELADGDIIHLAGEELRFVESPDCEDENKEDLKDGIKIIKTMNEIIPSGPFGDQNPLPDSLSVSKAAVDAIEDFIKGKQGRAEEINPPDAPIADLKYRVLYEIGKIFSTVTDENELLNKVLDSIIGIFNADRAYILFKDGIKQKMIPRVVKFRPGLNINESLPRVSRTVTDAVINKKAAVLIVDTGADSRFSESESLVLQNIKSAICVPIIMNNAVEGMIYVDTQSNAGIFSESDLELMAIIANEASSALSAKQLEARLKKEHDERKDLERYLSPNIVQCLLTGDFKKELGGKRADISVMYADIRGFTAMSDQLPAEAMLDYLNDYLSQITELIFSNQGTLDKYIGDCVMALFGAPLKDEEHAAHCVKCAIEIQTALSDFNREKNKKGQPPVRLGIGISSGDAIVGNMGSVRRMEYTAIGDTVNIASRLTAVAPAGSIYISEETYKRIEGSIFSASAKPVDSVSVKGKIEKLKIYEIKY